MAPGAGTRSRRPRWARASRPSSRNAAANRSVGEVLAGPRGTSSGSSTIMVASAKVVTVRSSPSRGRAFRGLHLGLGSAGRAGERLAVQRVDAGDHAADVEAAGDPG